MKAHIWLFLSCLGVSQVKGQVVREIRGEGWDRSFEGSHLIERQEFDRAGRLLVNQMDPYCTHEFTYDSLGRLTERSEWCYESNLNGAYRYAYNANGYCSEGELLRYWVLTCTELNEQGLPAREISRRYELPDTTWAGTDSTLLSYDTRGRLAETLSFEIQPEEPVSRRSTQYQYTPFDSVATITIKDAATDSIVEKLERTYDPVSHLPVGETVSFGDSRRETTWSYDAEGLLHRLEIRSFHDGAPVAVEDQIYLAGRLIAKTQYDQWDGTWQASRILTYSYAGWE